MNTLWSFKISGTNFPVKYYHILGFRKCVSPHNNFSTICHLYEICMNNMLLNFLPSIIHTWGPCKLLWWEKQYDPFNEPQCLHTLVSCRQVLWLGWRLLISKDVGLQKRHLVVERWNFQPCRRFDPKCSTLCQQGSYCILLRFWCASAKITGPALLLHEAERVE